MLNAYEQWMVRSNLEHLEERGGLKAVVALLRANGYPRIAEAVIQGRLEYLRGELRAERISYGELFELQSLVEFIDKDDVELLEAAGVPEFEEEEVQ